MTQPHDGFHFLRVGALRVGPASGLAVVALLMLLCAPLHPACATGAPPAPSGKQLYDKWCAACHAAGPGHPGTLRLSVDRSPAQSVLVERPDLTIDYISTIVRVGFGFMPPFRATELTDPEVAAVARFITSQAAGSRGTTGK